MNCIECGIKLRTNGKVCIACKKTVRVQCCCGCGEYILKYNAHHRGSKSFRFKRGHATKLYWTEEEKRFAKLQQKKEKGHRNKVALIKYYGGKCLKCGLKYDGKNACVFQFHHVNPDQKTWKNRGLSFTSHSLEKLFQMTDKCEMLCANCHKQKHSAFY